MSPARSIAVGVAACLLAVAAFLALERGGLLAWGGIVLGAGLLFKAVRRPSPRDAVLAVAAVGLWGLAWGAAWKYVESGWESGEVVEIEVDGAHTARVWVLDTSDGPVLYYDAPPEAASRLLAGAPLSMTRGGRVRHECAAATRVEELAEERIAAVLEQMEAKYEAGNTATAVFYTVLGGRRDRVGLLIELTPCG